MQSKRSEERKKVGGGRERGREERETRENREKGERTENES